MTKIYSPQCGPCKFLYLFFKKTQKTFAFHFIEKIGVWVTILLGGSYRVRKENQLTSQVCGIAALRPSAPALAQSAASSLIFAIRLVVEGRSLSNTQPFLCFHVIQGTSRVMDARPLRISFGVVRRAVVHQAFSESSPSGGRQGILSQARASCQTCRAKGQARRR